MKPETALQNKDIFFKLEARLKSVLIVKLNDQGISGIIDLRYQLATLANELQVFNLLDSANI